MQQKLYRIRRNKMIGGVAAGLSEYFDVDVVFIRLFFVLATFFGGTGVICYFVLWIITPEKDDFAPPEEKKEEPEVISDEQKAAREEKVRNRSNLVGIVLISIGAFFLADNFFCFIRAHHIFPLILIGIGIAILVNYKRN
jgi:phage shock protein PspC (stress-responsive transcriptional regulator)